MELVNNMVKNYMKDSRTMSVPFFTLTYTPADGS
jgi:hypothetical protein